MASYEEVMRRSYFAFIVALIAAMTGGFLDRPSREILSGASTGMGSSIDRFARGQIGHPE